MPPDQQWNRPRPPDWYCPGTARSGDRCQNRAGKATDHVGFGLCANHRGMTPNGRKNGQRLMAEAGMAEIRNRYGYGQARPGAQIGPTILDEISRTRGCIDYIEAQLADMDAKSLVTGTKYIRRKESPDGVEVVTEVASAISPWVELHQRERKLLQAWIDLGVRAGIELRRLKLAEQEGELMGLLLRAALDEFPAEQQPAVYGRIRARLTQLRSVS